MAMPELTCPNCGAPLKVEETAGATTRCPYCQTEVVLPVELRPPAPAVVEVVTMSSGPYEPLAREKGKAWPTGAVILLAILLIVVGGAVPTLISNRQSASLAARLKTEQTGTARAVFFNQTAAVTATPEPTLTPTPQYAEAALTFGESGIGEGMFTHASYLGVDGGGVVYAADYESGRVQRFNPNGDYLSQWRFGDSKTYLHGLAVTNEGDVFLAYDQVIDHVNGTTGKLIQRLSHPESGEFGDLAVTADGKLLALWYEGRWGLITSLEGHREELVIFNPAGEMIQQYPNFISEQTEALALDVDLAVDGAGTVYALSDSVIFQFSPEGRFLDRINHIGEGAGQYSSANTLAVDRQGRVYVVDGREVYVYDSGQQFIDVFTSPAYLNALTIDHDGGIWGAAEDRVIQFEKK